jgi:hypothetical protein
MTFLGSANYSPDGTTFTWQSGRRSHVHQVPPSSSFKSNYKLQCHICDETIHRGDWATRVSEHWLINPDWCQPGVTLRGEAFTPNRGTVQMAKFTGCRIVHRDCCCESATHGDGVFTLQQWEDIFENEDHGTPFPAKRWPKAERIWDEVVQRHNESVRSISDTADAELDVREGDVADALRRLDELDEVLSPKWSDELRDAANIFTIPPPTPHADDHSTHTFSPPRSSSPAGWSTCEDDRDSDEWDSRHSSAFTASVTNSDERDSSYVQHIQEEECYLWRGGDGRKKFVCEGRSTPMGDKSFDVIDWNRAYAARFESDVNFDRLYSGPGAPGGSNGWEPVYDPTDPCDIHFYQENLQRCYLAEELRSLMSGRSEYARSYPDGCSWSLRLLIATQP